jgi:hypothetical protein
MEPHNLGHTDLLPDLISFDIDGTLEVGDPPGAVTMDMVRRVQAMGFLVGSCSDRPISAQRRLWNEHGIKVEFTVLKQRLDSVKTNIKAETYYHVGDTELERTVSNHAGFRFLKADEPLTQLLPH